MNEIIEYGNIICDICIGVMKQVSNYTGISYGCINVLLFIILGPLSTIIFASTTILSNSKYKNKKVIIFLSIIGIICIIPIFYLVLASILNSY